METEQAGIVASKNTGILAKTKIIVFTIHDVKNIVSAYDAGIWTISGFFPARGFATIHDAVDSNKIKKCQQNN